MKENTTTLVNTLGFKSVRFLVASMVPEYKFVGDDCIIYDGIARESKVIRLVRASSDASSDAWDKDSIDNSIEIRIFVGPKDGIMAFPTTIKIGQAAESEFPVNMSIAEGERVVVAINDPHRSVVKPSVITVSLFT